MVLGGDIGGTKTLLKLAEVNAQGELFGLREQRYDSRAYPGLASVIKEFLDEETPDCACFGVAGPVVNNISQITFLPWIIDADSIATEFGIREVNLINDFQAAAYGIDALAAEDLLVLNPGIPQKHGTRALIGAGTFLGEGSLVWQGDCYVALPSEGGHADFAPRGPLQAELLAELSSHNDGYVAYGNLLSGGGLITIYEFLHQRRGMSEFSELLANRGNPDLAFAISQHALLHNDSIASDALNLFVEIYAAEAGNLALRTLPSGGVYVTGGIAPQIIPRLMDGRFMRTFADKGAFSQLLMEFPVSVVLNPEVGVLGAILHAFRNQRAGLGSWMR